MTNKVEPTFNEYQEFTRETAIYPKETALQYLTLGLTGEAGEIANKVKKVIRDDNGQLTLEKATDIAKELGDVLWYLTRLSDELGIDLCVIAMDNLNKLESRKERGTIGGSGDNR